VKLKYCVTFTGEYNQKYSVGEIIFEPNTPVYFDFNKIPRTILKDKNLKVEKIKIREFNDKVVKDSSQDEEKIKTIEAPKRVGVTYAGPESETANINIKGYFRRGVVRWDLTDKEVIIARSLGKNFKIIEELL